MKLYYAPGVCSLASHIVAREMGLSLAMEKVDLRSKTTETGRNFLEINPKGYVTALELDDGEILTENPAILQYLAEQDAGHGMAPANGTLARSRMQEMLGFINSELHKGFTPLFSTVSSPEVRAEAVANLCKRFGFIEQTLKDQPFLFGASFGVADAYLFVVTRWADLVELDLSEFTALESFQQRVASRPAVQAAMQAEGLLKAAA